MPYGVSAPASTGPVQTYTLAAREAFTVTALSVSYDLTAASDDGYLVLEWDDPDGNLIAWQKLGCGLGAGDSFAFTAALGAPDVIVEDTLGGWGVTQPLAAVPVAARCSVIVTSRRQSNDSIDASAVVSGLFLWVAPESPGGDLATAQPLFVPIPLDEQRALAGAGAGG